MGTASVTISQYSLDDLRAGLQREPSALFAILDACDEPRVPKKVGELGDRAVSLYRGSAEEEYWAIAPYLVQMDEQVLSWIVKNLSKDPWGIFAVAPVDLLGLRTHFRRFLTVEDPKGVRMYFRFYDPRVLPTFLESCTNEEGSTFFGPIRKFIAPNEDGTLVTIERAASPRQPFG